MKHVLPGCRRTDCRRTGCTRAAFVLVGVRIALMQHSALDTSSADNFAPRHLDSCAQRGQGKVFFEHHTKMDGTKLR